MDEPALQTQAFWRVLQRSAGVAANRGAGIPQKSGEQRSGDAIDGLAMTAIILDCAAPASAPCLLLMRVRKMQNEV
ncbi:hypothetical protein C1O66_20415 [Paucibacter aquatile]|uniref:Uncharacterized protein n=1 Tax=Kinneretia aquatilis TaxID=2070761 RepID=A0A2N8KRK4_9BURK|nr:hypothetical protein [Paucibacter sp. B51]PND36098.1 hypothetical protein C1O66_20415 [Paucibacter aquatile]